MRDCRIASGAIRSDDELRRGEFFVLQTHQLKTWERWAQVTPPGFQFADKAPKVMTHVAKLLNCSDALVQFFEQIGGLDEKLGPVLLQLAPSHAFDQGEVGA